MTYCLKCSTQLTDSAKLCNTCGAPADTVASQPQTESDSSHYQIENTINSDVLQNFVGKNFEYFRKKWEIAERKESKFAWNWAAFLIGPIWLAYRKMYLYLGILIAFIIIESLIDYAFNLPNSTSNAIDAAIGFVFGNQGNYLYKLHVDRKVKQIISKSGFQNTTAELKRLGGTSIGAALGSVVIIIVIISAFIFASGNPFTVSKGGYPTCVSNNAAAQFKDMFESSAYARSMNLETIDVIDQRKISESSDGSKLVCQAKLMLSNAESMTYRLTFKPAEDSVHFYIIGRPMD
ncbi:MAG: DUF2628 domain-containing protein [Candidatus Nitrosoglobus sp.]